MAQQLGVKLLIVSLQQWKLLVSSQDVARYFKSFFSHVNHTSVLWCYSHTNQYNQIARSHQAQWNLCGHTGQIMVDYLSFKAEVMMQSLSREIQQGYCPRMLPCSLGSSCQYLGRTRQFKCYLSVHPEKAGTRAYSQIYPRNLFSEKLYFEL